MTSHEFLTLIDGLHEHMKRETANPEIQWPLRRLLLHNIRLNARFWIGDQRTAGTLLKDALRDNLRFGFIEVGGCVPKCHAQHISLTREGRDALAAYNRDGCNAVTHTERKGCQALEPMRWARKAA